LVTGLHNRAELVHKYEMSKYHIGQLTNTKPYGRDGNDTATYGTDQTNPIDYLL